MPIQHIKRQPPTYNTIQWTGDNEEEIQAAVNPNIFLVSQNHFSERLYIRDRFTNSPIASLSVGDWVISEPYNGVETDQFGSTLEVLSDADYQLQFIQSAPQNTPAE
jgi:hypothetical protein